MSDLHFMALQVIVGFILLNIIYFSAQLCWALVWGIYEDHYFFGFNPRLLRFKVFKTTISLGVYVPLPLLARVYRVENGEKSKPRSSWEFFQFPLLILFFSAFGGVVALLLIGILINIGVRYYKVDTYISADEMNKYGVCPSNLGVELGFRAGDKIIKINGSSVTRFDELFSADLYLADTTVITVLRETEQDIRFTRKQIEESNRRSEPLIESILYPVKVGEIVPGLGAEKRGLFRET